jgi:hypothetical protein
MFENIPNHIVKVKKYFRSLRIPLYTIHNMDSNSYNPKGKTVKR